MPIYEYECQSCGHRLEAIQKLSDDPLTDCPTCATPALRKLVSAAAFRLKGGGWYETDFKKSNQRNVAKSDSEASAKKQDKSDASAAPKSAAKGPSKGASKAAG